MSDSTTTKQSIADRVLSALRDVLYSARSQGYEPNSKFITRYRKYVTEINSARSKNGKARAIAKHFVPNEEEYNKKVTNYSEWYKDEHCASLLKLLDVFREIALAPPPSSQPKERRIPTKDEVDDFMNEIFGKKD